MTRILLTALLLGGITLTASAQRKGCSTIESSANKAKIDFHSNVSDTTKSRGLADNYFLWDLGTVLKVKFLSGTPQMQNQILTIAKEWEKYANIKFVKVNSGDADIRVFIGKNNGHNSFIGTVAKQIDKGDETMNIDSADIGGSADALKNVTLHEFGHALGLLHEHSSPISGINWDKKKMYASYAEFGWTQEDVDYQVFRTYKQSYTNGTKYDPKSIMHYPVLPGETVDGYTVGWNYDLSAGDKELIKALYPMKGKRKNEVISVVMQNFSGIIMQGNEAKGGLSLFPSLDLKTGNKGGPVKMVFRFYDENGYPFEDIDDKYEENGIVATMRTVTLPAKKVVKYNQAGKKDFEFFLPFDQIPEAAFSQNMIVTFTIAFRTNEGEQKNLYTSNAMQFSYKKK